MAQIEKQAGDIEKSLDDLGRTLEEVSKIADELGVRLAGILSPPLPQAEEASALDYTTELSRYIGDKRNIVLSIRERLQHILKRIEL
jgi:hypothetical protein